MCIPLSTIKMDDDWQQLMVAWPVSKVFRWNMCINLESKDVSGPDPAFKYGGGHIRHTITRGCGGHAPGKKLMG